MTGRSKVTHTLNEQLLVDSATPEDAVRLIVAHRWAEATTRSDVVVERESPTAFSHRAGRDAPWVISFDTDPP